MVTQARLKELYDYNPETGLFTQRFNRRGTFAGRIAGSVGQNGYIKIAVDQQHLMAHRLAWLYVHGEFPENVVDHINGVRSDNRIENLRACTHSQNLQNAKAPKRNTSGVKGVSKHPVTGRWKVTVTANGKNYHGGYFANLEDARIAVEAKRKELHGEFARHG